MPVLHFCSVFEWQQATSSVSNHVLDLHTTTRELVSTNLSIPIILCASQVTLQHHSRVCSMQIDYNTSTTLTPAAEWIVRLFLRQVFRPLLFCPSGTKCACKCMRTYCGLEQGKGGGLGAALLNISCVNLELEMENGVGPA